MGKRQNPPAPDAEKAPGETPVDRPLPPGDGPPDESLETAELGILRFRVRMLRDYDNGAGLVFAAGDQIARLECLGHLVPDFVSDAVRNGLAALESDVDDA